MLDGHSWATETHVVGESGFVWVEPEFSIVIKSLIGHCVVFIVCSSYFLDVRNVRAMFSAMGARYT